MHNAALAKLGLDAVYLAFDVHPDRLMEVLPAMRDMGFGGVNLTVPLKEVAFRGIHDLDESARRVGAVNTVEFTDGGLRGHNTDGKGFLLAIEEAFDATLDGLSVFVLGSGGAGRALAITCAGEGAARIALTDLDPRRPPKVAEEIAGINAETEVAIVPSDEGSWCEASRSADLVIQATPVGMKADDPSLLPPEAFSEKQMLFDLVYMYPETAIVKAAIAAGARAANGLGMLLHQGAWAFTIWTGQPAAVDAMRTALEQEVYGDGEG